MTNYESFQNLDDWLRLVRQAFLNENMPLIALVGNKYDLMHMRAVSADHHAMFAEENEMQMYFCSAKTGDNVHRVFFQLAADLTGVVLTKSELEVSTPIVRAEVVNHQQHDESVKAPDLRRNQGCQVQ